MILNWFRRRRATDRPPCTRPTATVTGSLTDPQRRRTDEILDSLQRHHVLFDDEFELGEVYAYLCDNGPDDPVEPFAFADVIAAVAHAPEPLTNLVFIPSWAELNPVDVEEFTESICWLAGINTSAVALPGDAADPAVLTVRFELESGEAAQIEVTLAPKGIPEGLIEGLDALLGPRLLPRQLVGDLGHGDLVLSALGPDAVLAVNAETSSSFVPVTPNPHQAGGLNRDGRGPFAG